MINPSGDALMARIKELEDALREIAEFPYIGQQASQMMQNIARKALNAN